MNDPLLFGAAFWGFLILYGAGMYALSPRAVGHAGFFRGHDEAGRPAATWALGASIFISWIFAKSITNAANLGATYGIVGGLAYATYWLSIPLAGWAILRLRRRYAATGLLSFLITRHGRLAALAFSLAILVRLFNEVWSNTSVVGGYYGEAGSAGFIGAALLFTAATLFYSLKGGLRSSIYTDVLQTGLFVLFFAVVLLLVLPTHGPVALASTGDFRLDAGVDLLLVAALQVLSYPFHDPVLTDRGFITEEKRMLRAFVWARYAGWSEEAGVIAVREGWLGFPGVFEEPRIPLDSLSASVRWTVQPPAQPGTPSRWQVEVRQARFANAEAAGQLEGTWRTGDTAADRLPGHLALRGSLSPLHWPMCRQCPCTAPASLVKTVWAATRATPCSAA